MSTPAQILANQANAQHSTGPVTVEGKAHVSQNATRFGLFSATGFVRPEERQLFEDFRSAYTVDLSPQSPVEETLAREIIHAAWRLRRCAEIESGTLDTTTSHETTPDATREADLDRLQSSVDRARASAQRSLHRSLAELRRVQTERVYRAIALPAGFDLENPGQASCRQLDPPALFIKQIKAADAQVMNHAIEAYRRSAGLAGHDSAKQTQSRPAAVSVNIARSAPCPFGSRENHARSRSGQALCPPVASPR